MQIRYYVFILIAVFMGTSTHAQMNGKGSFWERTSVEAGWGVHLPTKPAEGFLHKEYISGKSFYAGGQYELNPAWGLRFTYAYNNFHSSDYDNKNAFLKLGLTQHKLMPEVVFSPMRVSPETSVSPFEFKLHAGLGLTMGKSGFLKGYDKTFTFQGGLLPTYWLSDRFALQLDMVMVLDFWQAYDIDGIPISDRVGNYFYANFGLTYNLGH